MCVLDIQELLFLYTIGKNTIRSSFVIVLPLKIRNIDAFHLEPRHFLPIYYKSKVSHMAKTNILSMSHPLAYFSQNTRK